MKSSPSMAMKHELFFLATLLLTRVSPGSCGRVATKYSSSSGLVCNGDGDQVQQSVFIVFKEWASSYGCNQTRGFMPCSATVPGNLLLILVYVSLMLFGAKLLYDGSAILVELLSPGIAGAVFLPLLSTLLDAIINIASRLCGNEETAQNQVSAGIGLLTGSTAILLTLLGGCCIIVDKCDLENSKEKASEEASRGFSLAGSAVSIDIRVSYTARIMLISVMPFIIVQLAQVLNTSSQICLAALISLIIFVSLLLAYCLHQVFHPSILKRRLACAFPNHIKPRTVKNLKCCSLGRLLTATGEPDVEVIRRLFEVIGENSDRLLLASELRALIIGIQIKDNDSAINDAVGEVMKDFDSCGDSKINIDAFIKGISSWLTKAKHSAICSSDNDLKTRLVVDHFNLATNKEHELMGIQSDEVAKMENPKWSASKAVLMLVLGSLMAATFADPLVNAVGNFSTATNIPSFFVSFVVLPFASFSEAVSAQIFASQNKLGIASLTFSEIYGPVSMNNYLCISVFLGLVYFHQLTWNFTSEVLIVLIIWSFLPKEYG